MKQVRRQDAGTKTQTGLAPADEAAAPPVRRGSSFADGFRPKAAILALLLGLPLGASLLMAGDNQPNRNTASPKLRCLARGTPLASTTVGSSQGSILIRPRVTFSASWWSAACLATGIAAPGATFTSLGPANNLGVESENYGDLTHSQAVFHDIRRGTFSTLLEVPGMPFSFGDGIHDFGHGSGVVYASGDFNDGGNGLGLNWVWDGESYSFFAVPGAVNGAAAGGINNRDQVSGYYLDSSGLPKGFLKDGPNFTTIAAPGAIYTLALGINNLGVVTGEYVDANHVHHGYFWRNGQFVTVDVNLPGSLGNEWYGSNEHGDLAGVYLDDSHEFRAAIAERLDGDAA